jgi:signal transduction histidine kinase
VGRHSVHKPINRRPHNLFLCLQSARERERALIAREIHDELGQALTALKIDLSWLANKLPKNHNLLIEKTRSMSRLVDTTLNSVKKISSELRPWILDELGLQAAIEWQSEEFQKWTGVECKVAFSPEKIILDKGRSIAIFRIFQEALTNIARHTNATRVSIRLTKKADKVVLRVKDNGRGISPEQISSLNSLGLIGMRERAHYWEGEVRIKGIQNKGTEIIATIPLNKKCI